MPINVTPNKHIAPKRWGDSVVEDYEDFVLLKMKDNDSWVEWGSTIIKLEPFNTLEIPNPQKNPNSKDDIEKKESKYKDWVEWADIFFNIVNSRLEITKIQK
jgi:hypothetical protein